MNASGISSVSSINSTHTSHTPARKRGCRRFSRIGDGSSPSLVAGARSFSTGNNNSEENNDAPRYKKTAFLLGDAVLHNPAHKLRVAAEFFKLKTEWDQTIDQQEFTDAAKEVNDS